MVVEKAYLADLLKCPTLRRCVRLLKRKADEEFSNESIDYLLRFLPKQKAF